MQQAAVVIAVIIGAVVVECVPAGPMTRRENIHTNATINGYVMKLFECLNQRSPTECCGLRECNIRAMVGIGKQH